MLVICTRDGLTIGSKLYRAGDVFVLTGSLGEEYKGLSDERWLRKQNKVYKEVLFRRPTPDEIRKAIADKKVTELTIKSHFDKSQLKIAMEYLRSKHLAQAKAAEAFIEKAEMEISEDVEEEKAEIAKAPEEAPKEEKVEVEKVPEEAPKEEKVEAPAEEEKTEGEVPVEEEAPDKTDTPSPEEPSKKKDKEKGKR